MSKAKPTYRQPVWKWFSRSEGIAAVEFAIVLNILLLIFMGIAEFGHAWYLKQIIAKASQEGARYGVIYRTKSDGTRLAPSDLASEGLPSIADWVKQSPTDSPAGEFGLVKLLPADANLSVVANGSGYTTGTPGTVLNVTVSCDKKWFVLSKLLPFGEKIKLTAKTVMRME